LHTILEAQGRHLEHGQRPMDTPYGPLKTDGHRINTVFLDFLGIVLQRSVAMQFPCCGTTAHQSQNNAMPIFPVASI